MATRDGRRPRRAAEERAGIAPAYEGPEALSALLARAGSPFDTGEVQVRFAEALARGLDRSVVIPGLFPSEPRFASPDEARRLYQNLFGLWERVASGLPGEEAPPPPPRERPPLAPRGSLRGEVLPPELVEAVWQELDALGPAERRRADARFEAAQPDLSAWLAAVELPEAGGGAALGLTLEAWAMLDWAFGDRLGPAAWRDLKDLAAEPPALERAQPALAAYVAEQLENLADEEPALGAGERAQVERVVATAVAALMRTLARDA